MFEDAIAQDIDIAGGGDDDDDDDDAVGMDSVQNLG